MTNNEIGTLIIAGIAAATGIASAVYAKQSAREAEAARAIAQAALRFQVLVPALNEYRSAQMYIAIRALWAYYKLDPKTLAERFEQDRARDLEMEATVEPAEFVDFIEGTIDFHRRLVSQFYNLLTSIYAEGGDQRKWLYTYWSKRELRIIPRILIPLERALANAIQTKPSPVTIDRLQRLYEDSPDFGGR